MAEDDYKKYEELLLLRYEIDDELNDIKDNVDDKTYKRLEKLKNNLEKKHENESIDSKLKEANEAIKILSLYQCILRAFQLDLEIDPGRLTGITDGIFGGVMTLLIFGLALPNFTISNSVVFSSAIESLVPTAGITVISFILISSFWICHHNFFKLKTLNVTYLWLNVFFLIFVSFIPFSTSLIGTYSDYFLAAQIFGFNVFFVLLSLILMYWYANKRGLMENEIPWGEQKHTYNTFLFMIGFTLLIIILDLNSSEHFIYLYLFVPIFSTLRDISFKIKHKI